VAASPLNIPALTRSGVGFVFTRSRDPVFRGAQRDPAIDRYAIQFQVEPLSILMGERRAEADDANSM
jgi:hypothetical protein